MLKKQPYNLALTTAVLVLLVSCGVNDQPSAAKTTPHLQLASVLSSPIPSALNPSPMPSLDAAGQTLAPEQATFVAGLKQTTTVEMATVHALQTEVVATERVSTPATLPPAPTFNPGPTRVSPHQTPATNGYISDVYDGYPSKSPRYKNLWKGDLPDGKQVRVYAGGYHSQAQYDTSPALGAFDVQIRVQQEPGSALGWDTNDPRWASVTLPVWDGYARVVDARMTDTQILVSLRTEGGSTYTYEVNSHTLTQTGGPTATPLAPGAPTPTLPRLAP